MTVPGEIEIVEPLTLADHARVPEKEPGFVSAQMEAGALQIAHDGTLQAFAAGDVLGGTQGGGYLVRVVSSRAVDSTHVELETAPADLTEFITEGHFRVHYDAAHAQEIDGHVAPFPDVQDERAGEPIASHAEALKIQADAPLRLIDVSAAVLPASCGIGAGGTAELDATVELSPVLDLEVKIGPKGTWNRVPELKRFRFVASGRFDVSAKLRGTGTATASCTIDLLELSGLTPTIPLPTLTFWAGPVPVVVTSEVVPKAQAEVGLSFTAADLAAEAQTRMEVEAGVDYEDHDWNLIWQPSSEAHGTASIKVPGPLTAFGQVRAGAEIRARLYGVIGPNVGLVAYTRAEAETASPYCTYDAWINGGVEAYAEVEAGVSAGPLHLTLARLNLVNLELFHCTGPHISGELRDAPECRAQP
jgi:hypothetical protein